MAVRYVATTLPWGSLRAPQGKHAHYAHPGLWICTVGAFENPPVLGTLGGPLWLELFCFSKELCATDGNNKESYHLSHLVPR